ncbi:MAG: sulfotransferase [Proteobacteria bacterium]|nr:sulfotransferase [Pseudomonadota bacterium]
MSSADGNIGVSSDASVLTTSAWALLAENRLNRAVAACRELHRRFPGHAEGWHVASHVAQRIRKLDQAVEFIDKALSLDADNPVYRVQQASLLRLAGRLREARSVVLGLVGVTIPSPSANNVLGATLSHFDLHEEALEAFEQAIAGNPQQAHYYFNRAAELRFLGRLGDAERACNDVLALDPGNHEAILMRSDLRRQTPGDNHVAELRQALIEGIADWRAESQLCFALAKEYEDLGDYARSFEVRQRGAHLRRSYTDYDVGRDIEVMEHVIASFPVHADTRREESCGNDEAIFILGLPRTGTTLLERIMGGHTDIVSAGELNNFATEMLRCVHEELGGRAPESRLQLVEFTARTDFARLGANYINSTRPVTGTTPRFIDKLPLNYLYAGLIHRALPRSRIIHMCRHPVAACYSVYKQPFRDAYPFSYDLEDLGRYYLAYDRLMAHWREYIPDSAMTEVYYEDLVSDPEAEARRILAFCGVEWQPNCLEFHRRKAASTTASAAQVRQPVHARSVDMWRNYERQLTPLIRILEDGGVDIAIRTPLCDRHACRRNSRALSGFSPARRRTR